MAGWHLVAENAENQALWEEVEVEDKDRGDFGKGRRDEEGGTTDGGSLRGRKGYGKGREREEREETLA